MTSFILARMFLYPGTGPDEAAAWESIAALMNDIAGKGIDPITGPQAKEMYKGYMRTNDNIFHYWESVKSEYDGKRDRLLSQLRRGDAATGVAAIFDSCGVERV